MNVRPNFLSPDSLSAPRLDIAVIGSGISGLSAAWLLSKKHNVTLFEADGRLGGHSNTVDAGGVPVDTGFIVYNEATYPNLTALFAHLDVPTKPTDMSFAVSMDQGAFEYSGCGLPGLFADPRNALRPRFWSMLRDLFRFYREAPRDLPGMGLESLDTYLDLKGYGAAFREDHLYPMAAAIWSTPAGEVGRYPAASFVRFCENHGLLKLIQRPIWRTVDGGSRTYVARLTQAFAGGVQLRSAIASVRRVPGGVEVREQGGLLQHFDHAVIATHADQALRMLDAPRPEEARLLGAFGYSHNEAVLHCDPALMPRRRRAWAAWNYLAEGRGATQRLSVTYWMNALQGIPQATPLFVTLNPSRAPDAEKIIRREAYTHPIFDARAMAAQKQLWSLQGAGNVWFCGAYFGAGFHEDGLQAGLAVAEALGGVRRPWSVPEESGRIHLGPLSTPVAELELAS